MASSVGVCIRYGEPVVSVKEIRGERAAKLYFCFSKRKGSNIVIQKFSATISSLTISTGIFATRGRRFRDMDFQGVELMMRLREAGDHVPEVVMQEHICSIYFFF